MRFNEFEYLPNPDGLNRPIETVKEALEKKFGKNRFKFIGNPSESQSTLNRISNLPFENWIVPLYSIGFPIDDSLYTMPTRLAVLLTQDRIYFLGPNDYNDFLHKYGNKMEFPEGTFIGPTSLFLYLYDGTNPRTGMGMAAQLSDIVKRYPELGIDFEKVTRIETIRKGSPRFKARMGSTPEDRQPELLVDFHTLGTQPAGRRMMPQMEWEYIITRYLAAVREKREVELSVIERNPYRVKYRALPGEPPLK